ncbi:hypothetical protein ACFC9E_08255 [Enterococcus faecium]|uniref:hypothetical protein n=1 Tax=Enterococcus faecium TaxID=1352 RepID=UPI0039A579E0
MERVNMKEVTVEVLRSVADIKKISTDYPSTWNTFPLAIYRTSNKPHVIDSIGNELQTEWTITVELYGDKSQTSIAESVLNTFSSIGFSGTAKDANTADLKRIIIEISAIVDNVTKYVYKK